jgi:hypothetical protein
VYPELASGDPDGHRHELAVSLLSWRRGSCR